MKKVTVIVPIYNVEKYLKTCFESLKKQTSTDFTVLAINDGSTDGCEEIIKEYVHSNPELFQGIKKDNGGYGSVLQVGIKECKTPYFIVCDPDDSLVPEAIQTLLDLAQLSHADITIGAKTILHEGSNTTDYDCAYNKLFAQLKVNNVYNKGTTEFNDLFFVDPSPHAKLYRKVLAENITFPEHVGYTDNLLFYMCLLEANKVVYTDKALANYLVNRPGNTMTDIRFKAMNGQILVFKQIINFANNMDGVPDIFYYRMFDSYKYMLYQTRRMEGGKKEHELILEYLETFLAKLPEHGEQIKPFYKKYSKAKILERRRDYALMNPKRFKATYEGVKKKMLSEIA